MYQVLQINHAVILLGLSGTGKTTIYKTLCKAINSLNTQFASRGSAENKRVAKEEAKYPKVNLTVLFPRAMSESEVRFRLREWLFVFVDVIACLCFFCSFSLSSINYCSYYVIASSHTNCDWFISLSRFRSGLGLKLGLRLAFWLGL